LAARLALLIAALLAAGCLRREAAASRDRTGCAACHARHYVREAACHECHRGEPRAARAELAHARLLTGRGAEHLRGGGPTVGEGRRRAEVLACRRCHRIAGSGNALASDLDRVAWSREQAQLLASIVEPVEGMPRFGLDGRQAEALVAYLLQGAARRPEPERYRVHFARGAASGTRVFDRTCGGCHRALGRSGLVGAGRSGPNLSGLLTEFYPRTAPGGRAWTQGALSEWLRNPRAVRPATTMPPMAPTPDELVALVSELGGPAAP
jgi:mono/diheme cytochrome c family protein